MADAAAAVSLQTTSTSKIALNLQSLLDDLFLVLTEKESMVIKKRFALQGQSKQTLERIGKHFKVTRERIRQIESIALSKLRRTVRTTKLNDINEMAKGILRAHGGVLREDELISQVLKRTTNANTIDGAVLRLSFSIDNELAHIGRSGTFVPFWRLQSLSLEGIATLVA